MKSSSFPFNRRTFLMSSLAGAGYALAPGLARSQSVGTAAAFEPATTNDIVQQAGLLPALHTLIVSRQGQLEIERTYRGPAADRPVNVKSVSKTIIATLVGIAIDRKIFAGIDQPIAPLLADRLPRDADPRLQRVTIGNLLSMQAGLERTSGPNYGRWVGSNDWVRYALSREFVDEPGGGMLYSTGNSHLLSALLTVKTRRSTLQNARDWIGKPLDINIPPWPRDPQGIYFGGNDMLLSPRAMRAFGEMVLNSGASGGRQIVPKGWIEESWKPRTSSPFTGDSYGLGWFVSTTASNNPFYYAWGFGGQMIYVVPHASLVIVMTSDPTAPSGRSGYVRQLHDLVSQRIVPAAEALDG
ncbi:6-aminohexanoate hydrolase [Phyllobacterium brassicacearum]|uniref:6-aminohexanoate hydrolase n=1 Tax=Phyllobacterium brassicacearum TaxID=314235 RepID=A0A2P7BNP9_9HYPH|nr:serine hydrolase [Phyllobacterium brassicacearum]PSH68072.1 6-aminohexanoate hydrolase [Phyllobacterium brassicacearum]TDQ28339.1 CubicO group peptidase (beta-lactamase class C family) [Phyllobacterium brassicacearum]